MADYTMKKEFNYLVGGGSHEIRDKNERLIGYARNIEEAREQIKRRDGGTVEVESD
jgi:hypothetical protein